MIGCPFSEALARLNAREERLTGRPLGHGLSYQERRSEIDARLTCALHTDGPPDLEMLEVAGAHLLALHRAAVVAHTTSVASGDPA